MTGQTGYPSTKRFARFAWSVLIFHLAVIVWGAYVRATGSGAGCGGHWPLCNGEIVPNQPQVATIIEYSHRISSGLAVILVIALVFFAFRMFPAHHSTRRFAVWSLAFVFTEALLGATLVVFGLVARDASATRGIALAVHLVNTLLLLASLALTAWLASRDAETDSPKPEVMHRSSYLPYVSAMLGTIILGITGAIAALGDTLFSSSSLETGLRQDFSVSANIFLRLRVIHPILAMVIGLYVLALAVRAVSAGGKNTKTLAKILLGSTGLQLLAGAANLMLLAPVWLQMIHLLLADVVWIALVLLASETLGLWQPLRVETMRLGPAAAIRA